MDRNDLLMLWGTLTVIFVAASLILGVLLALQIGNTPIIFSSLVGSLVLVVCSFASYLGFKIRPRGEDDLTPPPPPPPHHTPWF